MDNPNGPSRTTREPADEAPLEGGPAFIAFERLGRVIDRLTAAIERLAAATADPSRAEDDDGA